MPGLKIIGIVFKPIKYLFGKLVGFLRSLPDLTPQGIVLLAMIFLLTMLSIQRYDAYMFQIACICMFVFLGSLIFSYINLKKLEIQRTIPKYVFAREPFEIKVILKNSKKNLETFWLTIKDGLTSSQRGSISLLHLPPMSEEHKELTATIQRRGVYRKFVYQVSSTFPFGFFQKNKTVVEDGSVVVFPSPMKINNFQDIIGLQMGAIGSLIQNNTDYMGQFKGLREYAAGDSIKRVHWSASSRMQRLIVREMEPTASENIVIVIHSVMLKEEKIRTRKTFEKMLQFLSGLFIYLSQNGFEFTFYASFDGWEQRIILSEPEYLEAALVLLASAKECRENHFESLSRIAQSHMDLKSFLVVSNIEKGYWESEAIRYLPEARCIDMKKFQNKRVR